MDLEVSRIMKDALKSMSERGFQGAGGVLSKAKQDVREELQSETSPRIREIINKLAGDSEISQEDIDLIRLWVIGDAESYAQVENNFHDWLEEYKRLSDVLANYENKECGITDFFKLKGLLEDAIRVGYDIANYLEKKDRINKFQSAVSDGLDKEERDTLVDVLTGKLNSSEY